MSTIMPDRNEQKIGIVLSGFPRLSETFILHELLELERQGLNPVIFPLKPGQTGVLPAQWRDLRSPLHYVPTKFSRENFSMAMHELLALLARRPLKTSAAITHFLTSGKKEREFNRLKSLMRLLWLVKQVKAQNVSHLHAHFAHDPTTLTWWAARLLQTPYSFTAHAKDIYCYSQKWLKRKIRDAAFVVTCTDYNRRFLYGLVAEELAKGKKKSPAHGNSAAPTPIYCLHHGIDPQKFKPAREQNNEIAAPVILSVGRLIEKKGFPFLLEACQLLKARGVSFRCEIVGDGPMRETLERQIVEHGLRDVATLRGALSPEEVISCYHKASLFALPSFITESGDRDGIPNVILEAMAAGLPVVATNVSGIPEAAADGETGLLTPPRDSAALASALQDLLENPEIAHEYGEAGRDRALNHFSLNRNVENKLRLLQQAQASAAAEISARDEQEFQDAKRRPEGVAKIAYIMKGFPRLSETFIANEVRLLEKSGVSLRIFSVKREKEAKSHAVFASLVSPIDYLPKVTSLTENGLLRWLWRNLPKFFETHARLFFLRTWPYLRTLTEALSMCFIYRTRGFSWPKKAYIKEFLQAGYIADAILQDGEVHHLHAHFCHGSTTITMFVSQLTGLPYSFTAHAKDIYVPKLNPGNLLRKKIRRAAFVATCTAANKFYLEGVSRGGTPVHAIYHGLNTKLFDHQTNGVVQRVMAGEAPGTWDAEHPGAREAREISPFEGGTGGMLRTVAPSTTSQDIPLTPFEGEITRRFAPEVDANSSGDYENGALTPQILSVGRLVEKKGFPTLVRACRLLKDQGLTFQCLIVGEDGETGGLVRNMIRELELEKEIKLLGPMTHAELKETYRASDIFALPCQIAKDGDRDGIPNVLAEAMAMSLPVISTRVSGIPELVSDGADGLLVPEKDVEALAAALATLIQHNALRQKLGRAANAKIRRIFDAEKNTARLEHLFVAAASETARAEY